MSKFSKHIECYNCIYKAEDSTSALIVCTNPDPSMEGDEFGISKGWFNYPKRFDPMWKSKDCNNFEER